ncbi:MAG: hypothetical protein AAF675_19595, partial [Pseudomonadota bacterium]
MHLPALTLTTVLVSPAVDRLLAVALLVLGALVLLSIGPLGVLRDPAFIAYDLATFHTAGERLLAGFDPWRLAIEGEEPGIEAREKPLARRVKGGKIVGDKGRIAQDTQRPDRQQDEGA